jgi:hypothetical protein
VAQTQVDRDHDALQDLDQLIQHQIFQTTVPR